MTTIEVVVSKASRSHLSAVHQAVVEREPDDAARRKLLLCQLRHRHRAVETLVSVGDEGQRERGGLA